MMLPSIQRKGYNKNMKKLIIDTDNTMGIEGRPMDDALAILYLLGCPEDVEILGICCNYGNGTSAESYDSNIRMLNETGYSNIPVYTGSEIGEDPVSDSSKFILDMANAYPNELVYLGIGSLGNLYGAYLEDNTVFDKISQIVLMGGITEPLFIHDGQALDELNFSVNAKATTCVLTHGKNISIITGNNCLPVSALPKNEFLDNLCSADNPAGMYIAQKCGYRFRIKEIVYGADSSNCWDVVAAAYINHPEKFIDVITPCNITEDQIRDSGFLDPVPEEESNCLINIPVPRQRVELQELFYASWLKLKMSTNDANFSCKGLYLDKLIQPCVLLELSKEPCHGFLLLQKLKEDGYVAENLDPTGFYRNLRKMEMDGYLTSETEGRGPKARKTFTITDFGCHALLNWRDSLDNYQVFISNVVKGIDSLE